MGNQKQKWTAEEEDALQRGVQKYGAGKWKNILRDPDFSRSLAIRSNIDLKDKWRNLNVCPGQSSKDKSRTPKIKPLVPVPASPSTAPSPVPTLPNVTPSPQTQTQTQTQAPTLTQTPTPTPLPSQNDDDAKTQPKYNAMIFEALSTIKDTNGSDLNAIVSFIEQKHNFPQNQNFRRTLGTKLRRLVSQGKLEKVQNCYKIKDTTVATKSADDPKSPTAREMDSPASSSISKYDEAMKEAAETVAYRIADAENKSFLAAAAVKETERYAKFVEENDVMLKFAEELLAKCKLGGSVRFA